MKSAREIFEELGYKKVESLRIDDKVFITYKKDNIYIGFSGINEENSFCKWMRGLFSVKTQDITIQELGAITQQCKELGWIDKE